MTSDSAETTDVPRSDARPSLRDRPLRFDPDLDEGLAPPDAEANPAGEGAEGRVLMLAKVGLDEALAEKVLTKAGIELLVRRGGDEIAEELAAGAGALIVSAEALNPTSLRQLLDALADQPPWSDLPILALPQEESGSSRWTSGAMERLGNVIFLERPVRNSTLLSAVRSALRDRKRQYRFRAMLSRLEKVERKRAEFLVELGHEVRNPLNVVRNAASILRELGEGGPSEDRERALELIERQTVQLSRMVDDLLDVSRFNLGQVALERRTVDLGQLVRKTLERFSLTAKAEGEELSLDLEADEVPVQADPESLEQVIFHLVRAAIRDAPAGGKVHLEVAADGPRAVLTVRTAAGEATPALDQALPIVRNLLELYGGRVEGRRDGEEAIVVAGLPRRAVERGGRRHREAAGAAARDAGPLSVLVVEDSTDGREGLCQLLELKSYRVRMAADGGEALEAVREERPDVALVDIGLPDMDGYEVARRLREEEDGSEPLPLIALTGYGQPDDRRRALEAGFDLHLVKPVDPDQLFGLLADLAAKTGGGSKKARKARTKG